MFVNPYEQAMVISSTYRITVIHYSYGCATLTAAYCFKLYLENH